MGTTQKPKRFFAQVVSITGGAAISLADLLSSSTVGWGWVKNPTTNAISTTEKQADSFMADDGSITPLAETLYVGYDQFVRNAAAAGPPRVYQGAPTAVNVMFLLGTRSHSLIDYAHIWLYSVNTQNLSIVLGGI